MVCTLISVEYLADILESHPNIEIKLQSENAFAYKVTLGGSEAILINTPVENYLIQ
ncbi:hypothetical protein ABTC44_13310 [Acinetobacter baumannii]|jgi:hypothetical protein|nr:hypothetical protein [Acinetobacter baumannii]